MELICKKCDKDCLVWLDNPMIKNPRMKCGNCDKVFTMKSYIKYKKPFIIRIIKLIKAKIYFNKIRKEYEF
jgi:hypothetical protein